MEAGGPWWGPEEVDDALVVWAREELDVDGTIGNGERHVDHTEPGAVVGDPHAVLLYDLQP